MTDGCKSHAGDMGAQTLNFAPKFPQNDGIQLRICAFPTAKIWGMGSAALAGGMGRMDADGCRYDDFI